MSEQIDGHTHPHACKLKPWHVVVQYAMNSISSIRWFIYLTDAFLMDSIQPSLSSAESNDTKYDPVVVTISANTVIWISTSILV